MSTLTVGCATERQSIEATRDSSGVRILSVDPFARPASRLRVRDRPSLRLTPREEFDPRHPWLDAVRLTSGTIVVNDYAQLVYFDRRGRVIRRVGRMGDGPGEFRQTREICALVGDSLLVIDYSNGRLSVWDSAGRHIRSYARPGFVPMHGCTRDGLVVVRGALQSSSGSDRLSRVAEYRLVHANGTDIRPLGTHPAAEYAGAVAFEPGVIPLANLLVVSDPKAAEVRVYVGETLSVIIRLTHRQHRVSEEEWRGIVESMIPRNAPASQIRLMLTRLLPLRPEYLPAFGRTKVDEAGRIWLGDYGPSEGWSVFSSDGTYLGRPTIPPGSLSRASLDELVVVRRDHDGQPSLEFFSLNSVGGTVR